MILTIAPWTGFWERNYLVESGPLIEAVLTSGSVRGSVTGLGLVSLCAVAVELWAAARDRWSSRHHCMDEPVPAPDVGAGDLAHEVWPRSSG